MGPALKHFKLFLPFHSFSVLWCFGCFGPKLRRGGGGGGAGRSAARAPILDPPVIDELL